MHAVFSVYLSWWRLAVLAVVVWLAPSAPGQAASQPPPVSLRVQWGGGDQRAWQGRIELIRPSASPWKGREGVAGADELDWRLLRSDASAGRGLYRDGSAIILNDNQPQAGGAVELRIADWQSARLRLHLRPATATADEPGVTIEQPVATLLIDDVLHQLDARGNRLTIGPAPGALLRLQMEPRRRPRQESREEIWATGQPVRLTVHPLLPTRASGFGSIDLRLVLADQRTGEELLAHTLPLTPPAEPSEGSNESPTLQAWQAAYFDFDLPELAGVYQLSIEAIERGRLRWSRTLLSRTVDFPVVDLAGSPVAPAATPWQIIYRLDPGSPRLHERLRRLPGQAAESVAAMRRLSLPAMPMPSLTRAADSLPTMNLPKMRLPKVALPSLPKVSGIDSLVPTFGGLLATGDSTVEPHPLGAMLRLPPASSRTTPTWEGVVVAAAVPGLPHVVEIDYPSDQEAVVGVSVLEPNADGTAVAVRYDGGFQVPRPLAGESPELRQHQFVFWPRSRAPVIVLSNPMENQPATIGQLRVLAGPRQLVHDKAAGERPAGRRIYAHLPRQVDAVTRPGGGTIVSGGSDGWVGWYNNLRHSAAWLATQLADGVAVEVYAAGAGLWQSATTAEGLRWDGQQDDPTLVWNGADRLTLVRHACRSAGLGLVPSLRFDGLLPSLEQQLADPATASGLVCIGRDGQPRAAEATAAGRHYNVLDPRVQDAVAAVMSELMNRLGNANGLEGVAVTLPADGWLHLPGLAWGLDDRTFSRFARETGLGDQLPTAAGPDRHAARAAAVEGPFREAWLSWRAEQVAALHARLAAIVAETTGQSYFIMPTTLLFAGEVSQRFSPDLAGQSPTDDLLRELGLDPGRLTRADNAVYVAGRLHVVNGTLAAEATVKATNRSAAVAAWERRARRRGLVLLEQSQPLSLDELIPHGPFGTNEFAGPGRFHAVMGGAERQRLLVEGVAMQDAEVIFDESLRWAGLNDADRTVRRGFLAIPPGQLERLSDLPVDFPLWFQAGRDGWLLLAGNASRLPARLEIRTPERVTAATDVATGEVLPIRENGISVTLPAASLRTVRVEGPPPAVPPTGAVVRFDEDVVQLLADQVASLRHRERVIASPPAIPVLDNPGFDLPGIGAGITGWELVAPAAGTLELVVAARPAAEPEAENWAARFSSVGDLATIRSNPFSPPATGRASVAVWLRLPEGAPQPPLRIAVEGLRDGQEYYRFAPVGAAPGGRPLAGEWTRFVLQVSDLPTDPNESLRLRFDMLGPGVVEIDELRVFDLVLADSQRAEIEALLDQMEHDLATGATASLLAAVDGYWPRFLQTAVSDEQADAATRRLTEQAAREAEATADQKTAEQPPGFFDRVQSWWR